MEPAQPEKTPPPTGESAGQPRDEDARLMLRFRDGEQEAFEELVRRNLHHVHALIYRFLREPSMVDDVTQEVFLRIYRNAARYEPKAKFSTWLYRIVANLCFNVMRSRRRRPTVSLDQSGPGESARQEIPDTSQPAPDASLHREELQNQLTRAIGELPEKQRIAILLNKYENKNYEEIAAVLGVTTMAVKSLLSRARENLRHRLGRYVAEET